jgi:hypothetical protein
VSRSRREHEERRAQVCIHTIEQLLIFYIFYIF